MTAPMHLPPVRETTLDNGLKVVTVEKHDLPLVTMRLVVPGGSAHDPRGKAGLASFVAELARRGTAQRSAEQIDDAIESIGGLLGIGADLEATSLQLTVPSELAAGALDVVSELARAAAFPNDEVELGRRRRLAEIQQELDEPSSVADRALVEYFYGESHPFGHPGDGRTSSVSTFVRADALAFRDATWTPRGALLLFVGHLEAAAARSLAERALGSWRGPAPEALRIGPPPAPRGLEILLVDKPDATQAQVRFAVPGIARGDERFYAAQLANAVVGGGFTSRLVDEVRVNRGLSYSIGTRVMARRELGAVTLQTFTRTETVRDIVDVTLSVLDAFRASGPTADELEKARRYLVGLYPLRVESTEQLAEALAGAHLVGQPFEVVAAYRDVLARVTLNEAVATAKIFPGTTGAKAVIVGRASEIERQLSGLGSILVREFDDFG